MFDIKRSYILHATKLTYCDETHLRGLGTAQKTMSDKQKIASTIERFNLFLKQLLSVSKKELDEAIEAEKRYARQQTNPKEN